MIEEEWDTPELSEIESFVRQAAPLAWPANVGDALSPNLPGFFESTAQIGDFVFVDLFGGARTDVGFEVVLYRGRLVWGASYRGGLSDPAIDVAAAYDFLGRALGARPADALPVRGPREYQEEDSPWLYRHEITGDFGGFTSLERMYFADGPPLYERITVGGTTGDHASYLQWVDIATTL
ncbi:DUF5680 domain-containing protein [Polymorphospora sp. NPDC051019]|uniref:DUF5680 domain-containing protein n=1 Tax=Polymorphospora sp. NPDC051019 TaxID=3155725 RepID=UPI0034158A9A